MQSDLGPISTGDPARDGHGHPPSILFVGGEPRSRESEAAPTEPDWFDDLNLDQLRRAVTAGREAYRLGQFFCSNLKDVTAVRYRQAVLRDLEDPGLASCAGSFADQMRRVRAILGGAERRRHRRSRQGWHLDAAELYCTGLTDLAEGLTAAPVRSEGLRRFRGYLDTYLGSERFIGLAEGVRAVREALGAVEYTVGIRGGRVTVARYEGQPDYSAEVEATFAKFRERPARSERRTPPGLDMNHVLERVLDLVARLHPDPFASLEEFCSMHGSFVDRGVELFDREVQFYLAYLDYVQPLEAVGLPFCIPEVSDDPGRTAAEDAFDIVLAAQRVQERSTVVPNDFVLEEPERLLVVTGPNQGGKTTFARMVGQLHHLAGLGLSVPARAATLALPDRIFTHFERRESVATLRGKLEDELVRVKDILASATARSLVIMNESFASTTLEDALFLGSKVIEEMTQVEVHGVYVTFVDELASISEATVSMVAMVDPLDPTKRTFRIERRPADGLVYAGALAAKHGLTYGALMERLAP
jgi:DNA mismatch repair protein MutS